MNDKKIANTLIIISGILLLGSGICATTSFSKPQKTITIIPTPAPKIEPISLIISDSRCINCVAFLQNKCSKGMKKYIKERNVCITSCNERDVDGKLVVNSIQCYKNCRNNYGGDDGSASGNDVAMCLAFMDKKETENAQAINSCVKCSDAMGLREGVGAFK